MVHANGAYLLKMKRSNNIIIVRIYIYLCSIAGFQRLLSVSSFFLNKLKGTSIQIMAVEGSGELSTNLFRQNLETISRK